MDGQRPLGNGDLPGSPRAYEADPSVSPPGCPGADPVGFPVRLQPVRHQPGLSEAVPEMPEPAPTSDCPPGLECLNQMDEIRIHQQIDLLEVFLNIKMNNKYEIKNSLGQTIYLVMEDNNFCTRNCCGSKRPFTMRILDLMDQEVITLERPLRCNCFCLSCCLQEIKVCAPPGTPIGYITQTKHLYLPTFTIQNENKKDILKIIGPFLSCKCCGDINFEIQSLDKENVVGKISKLWTSLVRELLTDYSDFIVQFPADLDAKMKAVTLGACFLILPGIEMEQRRERESGAPDQMKHYHLDNTRWKYKLRIYKQGGHKMTPAVNWPQTSELLSILSIHVKLRSTFTSMWKKVS